jgi:hypothetical protein
LEDLFMKKLFAVCIIGLTLGTAAFADHPDGWGVGLVGQGAFSGAFGFGPAFSLKAPVLPIYWGISLELRNHYFGLGLTGDFYFLEGLFVPISGSDGFGYFIGVGGYLGFGNYSDEWWNGSKNVKWSWTSLGLGVRVPLGLNVVIPISKIKLEVFIDAAPSIGVGFTFYDDSDYWDQNDHNLVGLQWGVGFELGVRVWF